jgi:hypothetical protein
MDNKNHLYIDKKNNNNPEINTCTIFKTRLTLLLFIEVTNVLLQSHESICVLGVSILPLFLRFFLDFRTFLTERCFHVFFLFFFSFYLVNICDYPVENECFLNKVLYIDKKNNNNPEINTCTIFKRTWKMKCVRVIVSVSYNTLTC